MIELQFFNLIIYTLLPPQEVPYFAIVSLTCFVYLP